MFMDQSFDYHQEQLYWEFGDLRNLCVRFYLRVGSKYFIPTAAINSSSVYAGILEPSALKRPC